MVIAHNLQAMNAQRQFGITAKNLVKSTEKLSSGYKVNRAADDAAGLSISEKTGKGLDSGVAERRGRYIHDADSRRCNGRNP